MNTFDDEMVFNAVALLQPNAYGVPIRRVCEAATGKPVSIGLLYTALERLEQAGRLRSFEGEATPERGGRRKRYYQVVEGE